MPCPTERVLLDHGAGRLSPSEEAALTAHAAECDRCDLLMALDAGSSTASAHGPPHGDEAWARAVDRLSRRTFGRYDLVRTLGRGGMGVVYEAHDARLQRSVALKMLVGGGADHAGALKEARSMARLSHPNVVQVYDVETADGEAAVAMELVTGKTLAGWIADRPRERDVLEVMRGVARGLNAAHEAGVVHRDLKPSNVLLDAEGRPKVSDFGLAGLARAETGDAASSGAGPSFSVTGGTPAYMAPEVLAGQPGSARADQYALGVCLFEALTGAPPYEARTIEQARAAAGGSPSLPQSVGADLRRITERLLARDPEARYATSREVVAALDEASATVASARKPRRRVLIATALVVVALVGGAAWIRSREARATSPAERASATGARRPVDPTAAAPPGARATTSASASPALASTTREDAATSSTSRPVRARASSDEVAPPPRATSTGEDEWLRARR
jgi:serine/threonine-protein kinase